jgi:hypothetical protein
MDHIAHMGRYVEVAIPQKEEQFQYNHSKNHRMSHRDLLSERRKRWGAVCENLLVVYSDTRLILAQTASSSALLNTLHRIAGHSACLASKCFV